jgi:hypothetical protein
VSSVSVDVVFDVLVAALVITFGSCQSLKFFDLLVAKPFSDNPEIMENSSVNRIPKVTNVDIFLILRLRYLSPNGSIDARLQEENQPLCQDAKG